MVKKIDLFMPPLSQYGVLHYFTKQLAEALSRQGVQTRVLEAERTNPKPFLDAIFADKPDCTLSFNGLLPDEQGRFFCDMIQIPHVACLVDSPNNFLDLIKSTHTIITCIDHDYVQFFEGMKFSRAFFMPHGADKNLTPHDPKTPYKYDVAVLSSFIDFDAIRSKWVRKYTAPVAAVMDEAAEQTLSDSTTPYVNAFVERLDAHLHKPNAPDLSKIDFVSILEDLELYIKGKDRVELIRAVKDAPVDIFGSADGSGNWKKYLSSTNSNIRYNDPVPFEQALDIMKQSKILLNSSGWIKNGTHERIFSGMASGALVITNGNTFMHEHFTNGVDSVFYIPGKWNLVGDLVNNLLHDEEKRQRIVASGCKKVKEQFTWDESAKQLLKHLPSQLKKIA